MPSSFFECCTLLFEVMMRKLTPSLWKEKWEKVNKSCKFFSYIWYRQDKKYHREIIQNGFSCGKKKSSCAIIAFIFVYTIRYCKGNKGSISQSNTTPFFQNLSAKALHVSKLQDTEWVRKPDTKSPQLKSWPSQFFASVERKRGWRK